MLEGPGVEAGGATRTVCRVLITQMGLLMMVVADPAIAPANMLSSVVNAPPAAIVAACVVALAATTRDFDVKMTSRHFSKKK